MASVLYSEELTCSVCLTIFTDPVYLPCGHSFCRLCITDVLNTQHQCPQCGTAVSTEAEYLPISLILKSLAEKAKEAKKIKTKRGKEMTEVAELCPEHEEKLKLFCITDQQLACIICRDGERHEGHKFKPIKEAAVSLRKELEAFVQHVSGDNQAIESLANTQREEITKTKKKSQQLMTQISRQFEEMHQFLRKREDEIKTELKYKEADGVEKMSKSLKAIETALSESRELEVKATSVLKMTDPERFLKSWTEDRNRMAPEHLFRPRANELQVANTPLSLWPYESHLQFFVWKEMLQVIQPRAEPLSFKSSSPDVIVSDDGRSLFCKRQSKQPSTGFSFRTSRTNTSRTDTLFGPSAFGQPSSQFGNQTFSEQREDRFSSLFLCTNQAFSVSEFASGQHYWEIDVGSRDYWELGIKDNYLKYDGQKYATGGPKIIRELALEERPQKIGIYLNCSSKKLSFYDADNMRHIHTVSSDLGSKPVSAYLNIGDKEPDRNPVTVCWY